jgi:hypothetical protein
MRSFLPENAPVFAGSAGKSGDGKTVERGALETCQPEQASRLKN